MHNDPQFMWVLFLLLPSLLLLLLLRRRRRRRRRPPPPLPVFEFFSFFFFFWGGGGEGEGSGSKHDMAYTVMARKLSGLTAETGASLVTCFISLPPNAARDMPRQA